MEEKKDGIIISETKGDGRGNNRHFASDESSGGHGGEFAPSDASAISKIEDDEISIPEDMDIESLFSDVLENVPEENNEFSNFMGKLNEIRKAPTMENFFHHRKEYVPVRKREWGISDAQYDNSKACAGLMKELISNCVLTSCIHFNSFMKVLESGEFNNQFASNMSRGAYSPELRFDASRKMFGHKLSVLRYGRLLEKYGMLQPKNIRNFFKEKSGDAAGHYNDTCYISMVMRRSNLFDRTTYCLGDSGPGKPVLPQKLTLNFDIFACADGKWNKDDFDSLESVQSIFTDNKFSPCGVASRVSSSEYIELQFHGDVGLKDIASVVIGGRNTFLNKGEDDVKKVVSTCKANGIKVLINDGSENLEEMNLDDNGNIYYTKYESEDILDD